MQSPQLVVAESLDQLMEMKRWADRNPGKEHGFNGRLFTLRNEQDYWDFPAANQSLLKHYDTSPAHAKARMNRTEDDETPAKAFGRACHVAIFENERFPHLFAVREDRPKEPERPAELAGVTRQSKAGKEAIAAWEATWKNDHAKAVAEWEQRQQGKTFLKEVEFEAIYQISGKTVHDPFIRQFVEGGWAECAAFAYHPVHGVWMKAKLDMYLPERQIIVDLKTTRDNAARFNRDAFKLGYEVQQALYRDIVELACGVKVRANIILSVEKYPPYEPRVLMLSDKAIELGRTIYTHQLALHAISTKTDRWPGYERKIEVLEPPAWKLAGAGLDDDEEDQADAED